MPGVSGLELQQQLAASANELPIVFLSGHAEFHAGVRAMKRGAVDFLAKPFTEQDLLAAVATALERDRRAETTRAAREDALVRLARLTPRERQVCELVATGLLNKQIAAELGAAEKTIKCHRGRVMEKLAVGSVAELVRLVDLSRRA
jgi:FixJ family two-component response regulator